MPQAGEVGLDRPVADGGVEPQLAGDPPPALVAGIGGIPRGIARRPVRQRRCNEDKPLDGSTLGHREGGAGGGERVRNCRVDGPQRGGDRQDGVGDLSGEAACSFGEPMPGEVQRDEGPPPCPEL